jgi:hypothetical protein
VVYGAREESYEWIPVREFSIPPVKQKSYGNKGIEDQNIKLGETIVHTDDYQGLDIVIKGNICHRHTFIPSAAGEYAEDRTSCCDSPRRDSEGGVEPFEDGDDGFECMLTDLATAAKAGWDRGLCDASDKGEAENVPR